MFFLIWMIFVWCISIWFLIPQYLAQWDSFGFWKQLGSGAVGFHKRCLWKVEKSGMKLFALFSLGCPLVFGIAPSPAPRPGLNRLLPQEIARDSSDVSPGVIGLFWELPSARSGYGHSRMAPFMSIRNIWLCVVHLLKAILLHVQITMNPIRVGLWILKKQISRLANHQFAVFACPPIAKIAHPDDSDGSIWAPPPYWIALVICCFHFCGASKSNVTCWSTWSGFGNTQCREYCNLKSTMEIAIKEKHQLQQNIIENMVGKLEMNNGLGVLNQILLPPRVTSW